ncbi:MAG: response regulator NasT [Cocleimonas sp.]|jgi:response regulator NasT
MNDRVLLIFEETKSLKKLKKSLIQNDYLVFVCEINLRKIHASIKSVEPDLLVFYYKNAHSEITETVREIQAKTPIPIIIFSDECDNQIVSNTIINGASAFIIDGIESHRICYIIEAAKARFYKCQTLKRRLYRAESKLDMSNDVDKAKAIFMRNNNITAEEAYASLSKMASRNKLRIEDLSKILVSASKLLMQRT